MNMTQDMPPDTFYNIQITWIAYWKLQKTFKLNYNINITSTTQNDAEVETLNLINQKLIVNFVEIFCN